jgi:tetratricopeptide (TPR) repeat protein
VLLVIVATSALADDARKKAQKHFEQAEAYMKVDVYDKAIDEYRAAYALVPDAHGFLFNIGLAAEKMGNAALAIESYHAYLDRDPKGMKITEARARVTALERRAKPEEPPPTPEPEEKPLVEITPEEPIVVPKKKSKNRPLWYGVAAGALAAGLTLDLVPDSASNGKLDALDFAPAVLYAGGAVFAIYGTF